MADSLNVAFWLIFTLFSGWGALSLIFRKNPFLFFAEKMALSYLLGMGLISIEMAILSAFGVRFSVFSICVWWIPVFTAALILALKDKDKSVSGGIIKEGGGLSSPEKFFIVCISFETAYTFFRALIKPIESFDAIAIYALKSKIFYLAGCIPHNFVKDFKTLVPHVDYPLLLPLAETYFYTFVGSLNDLLVKAVFPLYYLSILVIFYCVLRREFTRKGSLLFTFLLATVPQFNEYATNGYADILLAAYYSASFFYLLLWIKTREAPFFFLSIALSVLGIWTKTEGLILVGANLVVILLHFFTDGKGFKMKWFISLILYALPIAAYLYIKRALGLDIHSDFAKVAPFDMKRIPIILYEYQIQFFGPKKWNIVWIAFMLAFIVKFKSAFSKGPRPITLAILVIFLGYTSIYMMTPINIRWHLSTTTSRLFLHFLPLVVLWLAFIFKDMKSEI